MPIYEYKGFDSKGKSASGVREAESIKSLRLSLRREGILATEIGESGGFSLKGSGKKSVFSQDIRFKRLFQRTSVQDISLATRQLGTLLQAGVPMVDALSALIDQIENEGFKRTFAAIKSDVNEGMALADAMAKHRDFTNIYVNMVRAGETSGALEVVLERLADFTEGQAQLRAKVLSAMLYPMIMVIVASLVLVIMLTTVIPRISQIFEHMKTELPFMTRILISSSNFLRSFWWLFIIFIGLGGYLFFRWKKSPKGKAKWDRFKLKVPIFGPLLRMVAVARFARTLSTLMSSGVPLLTSLQIVRNVVENDALEEAVDRVRDAVKEGEDIATPLRRSGQFPPMVVHMVAIGEKSGELETMLNRVATAYEQQVQTKVSGLTSLLEPVMILLMGGTVAFIIFAILTPIMQMSQVVK